ncbi:MULTISPECIES: PTS sugar transporter subunit IIB [Shouchella]|uniref:Phosphotransferase enzyme IIB component n=3 Tax=Bacillaceae TaxID=186817 RepID=A0A060LZE4_9BACI|nr:MULTISPECIES: PTS sugar transporter subunit IIB [Bacillaceae]AIC93194.1 phosphotransferase enzyme IIB component [Shouchella lehensis G1]KQL55990.1 PTS ascorbate transporter subunit IIB [Alkalicoccobacillus plakortidis]MBG9783041.1 PTS ascorbate transporter subunit IIB [Shouchella lehensis]TES49603.1 PTS sugar transporter subunit IIB [Shouchella lehensis]
MAKVKIMTVCGFGLGSSMVLKMNLDGVLKELGIQADVFTGDVGSAQSTPADYIFTSKELGEKLQKTVNKPVIIINSFVNKAEIKEKVEAELQA